MASAPSENNSSELNNAELEKVWKDLLAKMTPYDPRFPNVNQTRNCQQNYVDYHRCLNRKKDEDYCAWYKQAYTHLCPPPWVEKWDEQIEKDIFPVNLS